MQRDDLDNLLRRADEAAGAPPAAGDLAGRVRRRQGVRRRRRTLLTGTAALAAVIAVGAWQIGGLTGNVPRTGPSEIAVAPAPAVDVAALRVELAALRIQDERHEATAARFVAMERQRRAAAATRRHLAAGAAADPQWHREQAALVLVRQGDRLANELNLPEPAAVAYRQASATFAGTHWAGVARERLAMNAN